MANFVILIGGPGLFKGCDKAHDQRWSNYIVPLQLAAMNNLYKKQANETIHWVLYEPPYRNRWRDDSVITQEEKLQDDGRNLHSIRKAAADKLLAAGASSYIDKIKMMANSFGIKYKGINRPAEFWRYLETLEDNSISRVWYSGHASKQGLMLSLFHDDKLCRASAAKADMLFIEEINDSSVLRKKFSKTTTQVSKFYGCYTQGFAETWNDVFGVSAAGAKSKIDFGVVDRPSSIANIMERIEKTPGSMGDPEWKVYK
jgi:hypothetical protein